MNSIHTMTHSGGRPSKLTPAITAALVQNILVGATLKHAAASAGIDYATFKRWMQRGAQARRSPYCAFRATVEGAIGESAVIHLRNLTKHAADDWRASAWVLEHRFPAEYGNRARIEMEHSGTVTLEELTAARTAVLSALADYPAAQFAVAAKLAELDGAAQSQQRRNQPNDDDDGEDGEAS